MSSKHNAFELLETQFIESLNLQVERYVHRITGAQHIHLASDSEENVFLVALRTVPEDSTGVAHILEHTALCGSEKYPVRDPFFTMIKRSLNTFMNAFTSSDWTAYPFASVNKKDFDNLLDVYIDAVFFANLDELDFRQEGHRLEFAEPSNIDSDLEYKGVVYNEMKGAMSSIPSQVWQHLTQELHPSNTYHYNSGGDPVDIPNLSYEQLCEFYKTHYHPSNAIFMTFGNIPAEEHHESFESKALSRFERSDAHIEVTDEQRFDAPKSVTTQYTAETDEDLSHVVVAWLLGKSTDLVEALRTQLIAALLYENSASPLQALLENSTLGSAPSPMNGIEDSHKEIIFAAGLEGCKADDAQAIEASILECLESVAQNGFAAERVEACLHQLELQQREVGGDSYPYGLQLILTSLGSATHYGNPIDILDLDSALKQLREDVKDPNFVSSMIRKHFIENTHRLLLTVEPDTQLATRQLEEEKATLANIKSSLSEEQKTQLVEQAKALEARQNQEDDVSILPKVGIDDVPLEVHELQGTVCHENGLKITDYSIGTNGLVYAQLAFEIPKLNERERELLPLMCSVASELGFDGLDYLAVQNLQSEVSGGIAFIKSIRASIDDPQKSKAFLLVSTKGLKRNANAMIDLLWRSATTLRFDETKRIRDLFEQIKARRVASIAQRGHSLAMNAAAANMSGLAQHEYKTAGLYGIKTIKDVCKEIADDQKLTQFCNELAELFAKVMAGTPQASIIAEGDVAQSLNEKISTNFKASAHTNEPWELPAIRENSPSFWEINSTVNFCAAVYPTVSSDHPDSAALVVLGGVLRNGFLHRAIREKGGAYGGGATQDNSIAAFKFYSYRDPRAKETLDDFENSIKWLLTNEISFDQIEESILGVISSLDKPASPAGEAKQSFYNALHGRTEAFRKQFRERVLSVTAEDLKAVTMRYFVDAAPSIAVLGPASTREQISELSLKEHKL